jgi:hypothetical protein
MAVDIVVTAAMEAHTAAHIIQANLVIALEQDMLQICLGPQ